MHRSVSETCFTDKLIDSVALALPPKGSNGHLTTDKQCQAKENYPSSVWRHRLQTTDQRAL